MRVRETVRVAVVGHYGTFNLGDEAIVAAMLESLRTHCPAIEFVAFSSNPSDTRSRHGVEAFPVRRRVVTPRLPGERGAEGAPESTPRWIDALKRVPLARTIYHFGRRALSVPVDLVREISFWVSSRRRLRGVDLLLIAGSGQIVDRWGGPWSYPYTLLKWSLLGRSVGARVAFVSVGASVLRHALSRFFLRRALKRACYVSCRDQQSAEYVRGLAPGIVVEVVPDLAWGLETGPTARGANARPVVSVNPIPAHDGRYWPVDDKVRYRRLVERLAGVVAGLTERGFGVVLYSTHPSDEPVIDDILSALETAAREAWNRLGRVARPRTVPELLETLGSTDLCVASRFHGILLAMASGKPAVGLHSERKQLELFAHLDEHELCFDLDAFDESRVLARVESLSNVAKEIEDALRRQRLANRDLVRNQSRRLVELAR